MKLYFRISLSVHLQFSFDAWFMLVYPLAFSHQLICWVLSTALLASLLQCILKSRLGESWKEQFLKRQLPHITHLKWVYFETLKLDLFHVIESAKGKLNIILPFVLNRNLKWMIASVLCKNTKINKSHLEEMWNI